MDTQTQLAGYPQSQRRSFLKTVGAGAAVATTSGLVELGAGRQEAQAFRLRALPAG